MNSFRLGGCNNDGISVSAGAVGAARAAGVGPGVYDDVLEAVRNQVPEKTYVPEGSNGVYNAAYDAWRVGLARVIG